LTSPFVALCLAVMGATGVAATLLRRRRLATVEADN
jgi:hypothetical protein